MAIWFMWALSMEKPQPLKNRVILLKTVTDQTEDELLGIMGVEEALVVPEQQRAYLKVNERELDEVRLEKLAS